MNIDVEKPKKNRWMNRWINVNKSVSMNSNTVFSSGIKLCMKYIFPSVLCMSVKAPYPCFHLLSSCWCIVERNFILTGKTICFIEGFSYFLGVSLAVPLLRRIATFCLECDGGNNLNVEMTILQIEKMRKLKQSPCEKISCQNQSKSHTTFKISTSFKILNHIQNPLPYSWHNNNILPGPHT